MAKRKGKKQSVEWPKLKFTGSRSKLSTEKIQSLLIQLPDEYVKFLLRHNGDRSLETRGLVKGLNYV